MSRADTLSRPRRGRAGEAGYAHIVVSSTRASGGGVATHAAAIVVGVCTIPSVAMIAADVEPRAALSVVAVSSILAAAAAFVWLRYRWTQPLARTVHAARQFTRGQRDVRADETGGGREARFVAAALNRALDAAASADGDPQATAAVREGVQDAVAQIRAFGRGRLSDAPEPLPGVLAPIGYALMVARQDLSDRVDALYRSSAGVAEAAAALVPHVRRLGGAADEQRAALVRLAEGASQATEDAARVEPGLEAAIESTFLFGAEQQRLVDDVRDQLREVSRRAGEAHEASERARGLLEGAPQEDLRTELTRLCGDLDRLTAGLSAVSDVQPEPVLALEGRVFEPLVDLGASMVQALEVSTSAVRTVALSARRMKATTDAARAELERMGVELPRLAVAVTEVGLDAPFEAALLERLRRAQAEVQQVPPSGLTPAGQQMLDEVDAAAAAARTRLAALTRTTEAALSVLRVG